MIIVNNVKVIDFLTLHGCYPIAETVEGAAIYQKTPEFNDLMDRYYIRTVCIPNRLA
jgi:hypothetical protein